MIALDCGPILLVASALPPLPRPSPPAIPIDAVMLDEELLLQLLLVSVIPESMLPTPKSRDVAVAERRRSMVKENGPLRSAVKGE